MKTPHAGIDGELVEAAKAADDSTAIAEVLAGRAPYDGLPDSEQAVVRVAWNESLATRIAELDFTDELIEAALPWTEANDDGKTVLVIDRPRSSA